MQKEDPRTTVGKKLEELSDYGSEDEDEDFVAGARCGRARGGQHSPDHAAAAQRTWTKRRKMQPTERERRRRSRARGECGAAGAESRWRRGLLFTRTGRPNARLSGMGDMAGAGAEVVAAENVPMTATEARRAKKIDSLWSELQAESTAAFGVGPSGKPAGKGVKKKKTKKPKAQAAAKGLGEGTDGGAVRPRPHRLRHPPPPHPVPAPHLPASSRTCAGCGVGVGAWGQKTGWRRRGPEAGGGCQGEEEGQGKAGQGLCPGVSDAGPGAAEAPPAGGPAAHGCGEGAGPLRGQGDGVRAPPVPSAPAHAAARTGWNARWLQGPRRQRRTRRSRRRRSPGRAAPARGSLC